MILKAYAIRDSKAKAFMAPFFLPNDGVAIRAFSDNVNSESANQISKHPDDFVLYSTGAWDDETGTFQSITPEPLIRAVDVYNPPRS